MTEWDMYYQRLTLQGQTRRERTLERTRAKILKDQYTSPSCREVLINDIPQKLYITRSDVPTRKNFNTLPGETVEVGSVVFWENCHWLVIRAFKDDDMTQRGAFERCNRQLYWQNPETREIISRWCTIAKPYYSNLSSGEVTTVSKREFKLQLPYDEESSLLDLDKRFMLDIIGKEPKVYVCTAVDVNTERYDVDGVSVGFIVMNVQQDQYNAATDKVLGDYGICNYLAPFDFIHPCVGGTLILETSDSTIVPGGVPVTITGRYFTLDGQPMEGVIQWHVSIDRGFEDLIVMDEADNELVLQLEYDANVIGRTITIDGLNEDGTIRETVTLLVENSI